MRTLVEDDPEQQPSETPNIDAVVVEKTETFWSFLRHLGGALNNTRKQGLPRPLKKLARDVWTGKKSRK